MHLGPRHHYQTLFLLEWLERCGPGSPGVSVQGQHGASAGPGCVSEPEICSSFPFELPPVPGEHEESTKAPQMSVLVPHLWCLSLWSPHNGLACAMNHVWLSTDLWLLYWLLGLGTIITASSAFSLQRRSQCAGPWPLMRTGSLLHLEKL